MCDNFNCKKIYSFTQHEHTVELFIKPKNYLKMISDICICAYLHFENIELIKLLKLLHAKKLLIIDLFKILQHFFTT